jgi:hypothetical protein
MTLLYIAIRLTSCVADALSKGQPHDK